MEFSLELVNAPFVIAFLTWVTIDVLKRRRQHDNDRNSGRVEAGVFTVITFVSNVTISVLNLGFVFYNFWNHDGIVPTKSVCSAITWFLASLVTIYSKNKAFYWPLVLILWWVFSCIFVFLSVSVYLIHHLLNSKELLPYPWPEADIIDIVSLPLILLCGCLPLAAIIKTRSTELAHPLLDEKENENSSSCRDDSTFTSASIWSRLTFRWLNPSSKRVESKKSTCTIFLMFLNRKRQIMPRCCSKNRFGNRKQHLLHCQMQ